MRSTKLYGKKNSEPSFNVVRAKKTFEEPTLPGGLEKLYIDIESAEQNYMGGGQNK